MTNWQSFLTVFIAPAIATSAIASFTAQPSSASTLSVSCQAAETAPQIIASPQSDSTQQVTMLTFLPEYFSGTEALQHCETTANTLQTLYNDGGGDYLASDTIDGIPTICSVEQRGMTCNSFGAQVLFTLSQTTDPSQALYDMLGSEFKQAERPDPRTVSRIYTRINHSRGWWPF